MLRATALVKTYGGRRVVDRLDLACREGAVLGLLGPNGAGKTTTLRMLYGLVEPEEGAIEYDGRDFRAHRTEIKRDIGVCTQEDTLDADFTVRQNLEVYAGYFRPRVADPARRVDALLDRFGLDEYADHRPAQLSGGYKRRLLIARSIVHEPRILFLDEPTTGLDPRARTALWEVVAAMRREGLAVILTTHYMDEAERLSDEVLVISKGHDIAHGSPREVLGHVLGEHVLVVPPDEPARQQIAGFVSEIEAGPLSTVLGELRVALSSEQIGRFTERFPQASFQIRAPNLDDLFLRLSESSPEEGERR